MADFRITELVCDHPRCGHTFTRYDTVTVTRRAARAEGWLTGQPGVDAYHGRRDYCPDHVKEHQ
jgi:hypothetical protein